MSTKSGAVLTLFDLLSRLTLRKAAALLGAKGEHLIAAGGQWEIDIASQVRFGRDEFRLAVDHSTVTVAVSPAARGRLAWHCDTCDIPCVHAGAAFSLILEEKLALGLAAAPPELPPVESLSEEALIALALSEREERARNEKMRVISASPLEIWTDYTVTNAASGKTYRVALRGWRPGESYCSCPDFRKNTLGTCKHILNALNKARRRFAPATRNRPYQQRTLSVHLAYGEAIELRLLVPSRLSDRAKAIVRPICDRPITDLPDLLRRIRRLEADGSPVTVYPDAEDYIQNRLVQQKIASAVASIRSDPKAHPLRKTLLKVDLLPYQLDGIAFAAGAGRAILADEMGLGKTIQGIGVAEFLAQFAGIRKVLIVCPASVKSQWRSEILRFSGRQATLVLGGAGERAAQYQGDCFFTICNYEQVLRDIIAIERATWDLIILDEGQRIKNWEAKTTQTMKSLRSRFALVLSGTPLENRLDDLFSVVEFIDARRLGPAFRFFNRHRVTDEKGKVIGYRDLDVLRKNLQPVLLRRTRNMVMKELPQRTTQVIRISPTAEQLEIDGAQMRIVSSIVSKPYISEMDLLRLQKALLLARMNADSTFLVDKHEPGYSSKLDRIEELFDELAGEETRKVVLFSEWTTMLGLIERRIERFQLGYVRLDGSVPQKKRQQLVQQFQHDSKCRLFMTTNAGATGLNLQAANTVINVDLPWNPAILEQRIARAHRMGQKNPVHVYVLVTEETIEEKLLGTLSAKHDLALAALDMESKVREVALSSGMEELKRRLEVLLGAPADAPVDESEKQRNQLETDRLARRARMAEASGQLLTAAFALLEEMIPKREPTQATERMALEFKARFDECFELDEHGRPRLTVTLPDQGSLEKLTRSLASLLG
jgi:superfamily II DNA or RNA helicase